MFGLLFGESYRQVLGQVIMTVILFLSKSVGNYWRVWIFSMFLLLHLSLSGYGCVVGEFFLIYFVG